MEKLYVIFAIVLIVCAAIALLAPGLGLAITSVLKVVATLGAL